MDAFYCGKIGGGCTLTRAGCASRWRGAQGKTKARRVSPFYSGAAAALFNPKWGPCRGCEIGALHAAGGAPETWPDGTPIKLTQITPKITPKEEKVMTIASAEVESSEPFVPATKVEPDTKEKAFARIRVLRAKAPPVRGQDTTKTNPDFVLAVCEAAEKYTGAETARAAGISPGSIRRWRKQLGLPPLPKFVSTSPNKGKSSSSSKRARRKAPTEHRDPVEALEEFGRAIRVPKPTAVHDLGPTVVRGDGRQIAQALENMKLGAPRIQVLEEPIADPEVLAMDRCIRALAELSRAQIERVLSYLDDRFLPKG